MTALHDKSRLRFALLVLLAAVTLTAYARTLGNGFVCYDDGKYIQRNLHIQGGITASSVKWAFTAVHASNWHPVTWLSHMVDWRLYGANAGGHHLTNLLFHTANVLLLFWVLSAMTGSTWRSAFVSALFAVHPLHVESVAWIAERKDVLSTFFLLLTIWAYHRYTTQPGWRRYLPIFLFLALGLMSKPMLVSTPLVLLMLDYWPLRRLNSARDLRRLVVEKAPLFLLAAASCLVTYLVQKHGGAVLTSDQVPPGARISNAVVSYAAYLGKTVWPARLAVLYPHPGETLPLWSVAGASALLAAVTALVASIGRRHKYLWTGWLWYLVTLLPVIGLVQVGAQAMADRYTYIPLTGVFVMLAWGVPDALGARASRALTAAAASAIAVLVVLTYAQTGYWRNSFTLFGHTNAVTVNNYVAESNLGTEALQAGDLEGAVRHLSRAVEIRPDAEQARLNLGVALSRLGRRDEALSAFRETLARNPLSATAHNNIGNLLLAQGSTREAAEEYRAAIRLDTNYADAHCNLGIVLLRQGSAQAAAERFKTAIDIEPNHLSARLNLAAAKERMGDWGGAVGEYRAALRTNPDSPELHGLLAGALVRVGDYSSAWREAHLCLKLGGRLAPEFLAGLASRMPEPRD